MIHSLGYMFYTLISQSRWQFLEHEGPFFPPEYQPLPSGVRMKYKGQPCPLQPESEEVMTFYAGMLRTDYVTDERKAEVFNKNFFKVASS